MLILVRHGRTPANAEGRLQGRLDQDLDDVGRSQAEAVAAFVLRTASVDEVISSSLRRARQTAAAFGLPSEVDDRWAELAYGDLEGMRTADLPSETWDRWRVQPDWAPPNGEPFSALEARVRSACTDLAERAVDRNVVVVSHVSPIKAAVAWALDVDRSIAFRSHLDQASVCRISLRGSHPLLWTFNETVPD